MRGKASELVTSLVQVVWSFLGAFLDAVPVAFLAVPLLKAVAGVVRADDFTPCVDFLGCWVGCFLPVTPVWDFPVGLSMAGWEVSSAGWSVPVSTSVSCS